MKKNNTLAISGSDWERVDAMKDIDIDLTDIPEITPEQFAKAVLRRGLKPIKKRQLTLRLDSDVVEWFKLQGRGYQTQMNALLRAYMEEQKMALRRTKTATKRG